MQVNLSEIKIDPLREGNIYLFFSGCNFACPYCNTPSMLKHLEDNLIDLKEIKRKIADGEEEFIYFSGGEPTMQRQAVLNIARFSKDIGKKNIIHTNGSKPDTIKSLAEEKLVDEIILDLKAPFEEEIFEKVTKSKTFFKQSNEIIEDIKKTVDILELFSVKVTVFTTIVPGLLFRKEELLKIAQIANRLHAPLILQQFDNSVCLDARYMALRPPSIDFLQNLKEFLEKTIPTLQVELKTNAYS